MRLSSSYSKSYSFLCVKKQYRYRLNNFCCLYKQNCWDLWMQGHWCNNHKRLNRLYTVVGSRHYLVHQRVNSLTLTSIYGITSWLNFYLWMFIYRNAAPKDPHSNVKQFLTNTLLNITEQAVSHVLLCRLCTGGCNLISRFSSLQRCMFPKKPHSTLTWLLLLPLNSKFMWE